MSEFETMVAESRKKTHVVAIGGGAGLHGLLSGFLDHDVDLTAIITVADDGGSSGRIRKDFGIPPPGDIRRCLVALSKSDPLIAELFEYRFDEGVLKDHNFGNLFIAVLARLSGDFRQALERARTILGVEGDVIPATDVKVVLVADHPDGSRSTGEHVIAHSGKPIQRIRLTPKPPRVSDEIRRKIHGADFLCVGPGSLYTSVIPNLLVPGFVEAMNEAPGKVIFVANLLTQPGETDGFDLEMHLEVFESLDPPLNIDVILAPEEVINLANHDSGYGESASVISPELCSPRSDIQLLRKPLVASSDLVRHDPAMLAAAILACR